MTKDIAGRCVDSFQDSPLTYRFCHGTGRPGSANLSSLNSCEPDGIDPVSHNEKSDISDSQSDTNSHERFGHADFARTITEDRAEELVELLDRLSVSQNYKINCL